jgi:hypothetical protein
MSLEQEKQDYEHIMDNTITWQDVLIAQDTLMETIKQKLNDEPEHGEFWQQRLAVEMLRRQEILILANTQEEQEFRQSLQKICDNVLRKSKEQL